MTEPKPDAAPWRNFYGRRFGKKLRPLQKEYLETYLPRIAVGGVGWDENPARAKIDLADLFGDDRPVWLEIGFGAGEHLLHQAEANPGVGLIGCEPFINGVAALLPRIDRAGVNNIRIHAGDARDLLDVLPDGSITRAFVLYPDPWPKTRHHRRRFVNPENIDPLARVLKPGARFHVATDIPDYARHSLEVMTRRPDFEWCAEGPGDWRQPWQDWFRTRYETKALREGRVPHYLTFRRR
ncbi:MAG: tRNA (guanosine(46)-N7)-methyltransferase TrmB [Paracoccaceae bacterium]